MFSNKTKAECQSLCCADPKCRSFDHNEVSTGVNCGLSYHTKDEVGSFYKEGCQWNWNYYEVEVGGYFTLKIRKIKNIESSGNTTKLDQLKLISTRLAKDYRCEARPAPCPAAYEVAPPGGCTCEETEVCPEDWMCRDGGCEERPPACLPHPGVVETNTTCFCNLTGLTLTPEICQAEWSPLIGPDMSRYCPLIGEHLTLLVPRSMP